MSFVELKDVHVSYQKGKTVHDRYLKHFVKEKLSSIFKRRRREDRVVQALKGVNLHVSEGSITGIIGENGAGKTTLLRVISRLITPDSGTVNVEGSISSVFGLSAGIISHLSGRENIYSMGSLYGFSERQLTSLEQSIIDFSELGEAIDRPTRTYSAGMKARLGFSIIASLNTDIIVLDEALQAGDLKFRQKAGNLIERFAGENKILIVVSHSPRVIREYCNFAYYLHEGEIVTSGDPDTVCAEYESR